MLTGAIFSSGTQLALNSNIAFACRLESQTSLKPLDFALAYCNRVWKGWLTALDASTGKERWKYASPTPLIAGVTATSGGVLFTGDLNNDFLALDANTGQVLYRFNTGGSIGGGVISYALDGKQYAATTSGTVSAFFGGSGPPAVVIFALP
jgi:alcohol dehydrogenase (cytochrome c)